MLLHLGDLVGDDFERLCSGYVPRQDATMSEQSIDGEPVEDGRELLGRCLVAVCESIACSLNSYTQMREHPNSPV